MAKLRVGYSAEIAALGALMKRVDKATQPQAWRESVVNQAEGLMRLLLAGDHDPIGDNAAERPGHTPKKK